MFQIPMPQRSGREKDGENLEKSIIGPLEEAGKTESIQMWSLPSIKRMPMNLKTKYSKVKIYRFVEANICSFMSFGYIFNFVISFLKWINMHSFNSNKNIF